MILKSYQETDIIKILHYHQCDSKSFPQTRSPSPDTQFEYLKCLLKLKVQHIQRRFAVFLTGKRATCVSLVPHLQAKLCHSLAWPGLQQICNSTRLSPPCKLQEGVRNRAPQILLGLEDLSYKDILNQFRRKRWGGWGTNMILQKLSSFCPKTRTKVVTYWNWWAAGSEFSFPVQEPSPLPYSKWGGQAGKTGFWPVPWMSVVF